MEEKERAYDEFLATKAGMDDRQFDTEREAGSNDWTLKNVAAHVASQEDFVSKMLIAWLVEGAPFPGFSSVDEINRYSTVLRRSEQLSKILEQLGTAYRDVLTLVNDLTTDETLYRDVPVAYASRANQRPRGDCVHLSLPRAWPLYSNARQCL